MIEKDEEEPVIRNTPLLTKEELSQDANKKELFIYFCSLITTILIIVAISVIIGLTYGKSSSSSPSKKNKSNNFTAKYYTSEEDFSF